MRHIDMNPDYLEMERQQQAIRQIYRPKQGILRPRQKKALWFLLKFFCWCLVAWIMICGALAL